MNQHLERLDLLAEFLREPARLFIDRVKERLGVTLLVVYAYRDRRLQDAIYQKGREYDREAQVWKVSDQDRVVTNAQPGTSPHNVIDEQGKPASVAMDVIPLTDSGFAWWNYPLTDWQAIYPIAWECGWDPLGDKQGAYLKNDLGHVEWPGWKAKLKEAGLRQPVSTTRDLI